MADKFKEINDVVSNVAQCLGHLSGMITKDMSAEEVADVKANLESAASYLRTISTSESSPCPDSSFSLISTKGEKLPKEKLSAAGPKK